VGQQPLWLPFRAHPTQMAWRLLVILKLFSDRDPWWLHQEEVLHDLRPVGIRCCLSHRVLGLVQRSELNTSCSLTFLKDVGFYPKCLSWGDRDSDSLVVLGNLLSLHILLDVAFYVVSRRPGRRVTA
jgi:hypothetical protein